MLLWSIFLLMHLKKDVSCVQSIEQAPYSDGFFVWPMAFFILCITNFHWECSIQNTLNWHLTMPSLLAA